MSAQLLHETGRALYGDRWQSALARDLSVSDREVRRWVNGAARPRQGVYSDLLRLVVERQACLDDVERRLRRAGGEAAGEGGVGWSTT